MRRRSQRDTNTALLFQGHPLTVRLAARESYTLQPDGEVSLTCVSGSLWVTLDQDAGAYSQNIPRWKGWIRHSPRGRFPALTANWAAKARW